MNNLEFESARYIAVKYIGISKKTEYEVIRKLKKEKIEENIIKNVIDYLKELKYIDEIDYIDSYLRQNARMKKYSLFEITQKLKSKGINANQIKSRIELNLPKEYEKNVIEKIYNTKSQKYEEDKIKQYLYRRGFNIKES